MADQPYTPLEHEVRESFVTGQIRGGDGFDWTEFEGQVRAEFDRFIEAVKRDAGREALTTLAAEHQARSVGNGLISDMHLMAQQRAEAWRDHAYSEETP